MSSETNPIGTEMIQGIINGVNNKSGDLRDTMTRLMEDIIAIANQIPQINSPSKVFTKIGGFITQGLAEGIGETAKSAINAMGDVIEDVIDVAIELLDIHSPSRVFENMGEMIGNGFINGVKAIGGKVKSTVNSAFSDFDIESLDARYNISGTGSFEPAMAGGIQQGRNGGGRSISFVFHQNIVVGADTDPRQARRIGKQIYDETVETARSKGVDIR